MVQEPDEPCGKLTRSPHGLLQERAPRDELYPWRALVLRVLFNRTSKAQVRGMYERLFEAFPTPEAIVSAGTELESILIPLGL